MGIAITTTMLSRRAQFHQSRLVEHLSALDPAYAMYKSKIGSYLASKGLPSAGADGAMYRELVRQANALAFTDAFLMICVLILCVLPLVFIMKRAQPGPGGPPAGH